MKVACGEKIFPGHFLSRNTLSWLVVINWIKQTELKNSSPILPILHAFMKSRRIHHLLPSFSGINTNPEKIRMHINQHETEENINFLNFAFAAKFAGSEQHHRSNVWQFVIFKKYAGFKLATQKPRIHIMLSFRGCWRELWEFKSLLPAKNQTALLKILNFDFRHHHHFVEVIILTCNYTCDNLLKYWDRIVFQQLVKRKKNLSILCKLI